MNRLFIFELLFIPFDTSTPDERSIPLGFSKFWIFLIFFSLIPPETNQGNLIWCPFSILQLKDLSGGINETNIKKIQNLLNPNGIDLSSGVEVSKGIKSNLKINNLFKKFYDN